eukprot:10473021-Ditylum_brightwellii.AAC.2
MQWLILLDEKTHMKWFEFHKHKNNIVGPLCTKFHKWKQDGMLVKTIICDNAGENTLLEKHCNSAAWKLKLNFKYTARDMPQQNILVEVSFTTIGSRGRSMMIWVNVPFAM